MTSSNSTYICAACNSFFTGHKRKYCTDACRARAKHQPRKETPTKESDIPSECGTCGKVTWGSMAAAFCSPACRARDYNSTLTENCCEHCGNKYQGRKRKYCTTACQDEAAKRKYEERMADKPIPEKKCAACGTTYKPKTRHKNRKYCSRECHGRRPRKPRDRRNESAVCKECGNEFMRERRSDERLQIYCTKECVHAEARRAKEVAASRVIYAVYRMRCEVCEGWFSTRRSTGVKRCKEHRHTYNQTKTCTVCSSEFTTLDRYCKHTCSDECQDVARERTKMARGNNRRRARFYGVKYETVKVHEVFEAAGWRCQICGVSAPKRRRGKMYHNSPELDHITPISRGGNHTRDNLQLACRQCNMKKSNREVVGQMVLSF
jgi:hypothetical protein